MSAEWIAVFIAILTIGVTITIAVVSGFRRMDDRLRDVETRLDARLRDVETRLDTRLRAVETELDARLRAVETELAFLSGRRQEEPATAPAGPAAAVTAET